jgi:hypothetical protein
MPVDFDEMSLKDRIASLKAKLDAVELKAENALALAEKPLFKRGEVITPLLAGLFLFVSWIGYPFVVSDDSFYRWAHRAIFKTDEVMRSDFRDDRLNDKDGKMNGDGLYSEVKTYVSGEFGRRHQAIVASARGQFEYQVSPTTSNWTTDFSIPVFFNADVHDKVFLYVYLTGWGDTITIDNAGQPEKFKVNDLFEIRGSSKPDGTSVSLKLVATETTDDFHKIALSPTDMVPSLDSQFHRFDLALTDAGISILSKYAELEAQKHRNSETVRYNAYVLVQLKPDGAP